MLQISTRGSLLSRRVQDLRSRPSDGEIIGELVPESTAGDIESVVNLKVSVRVKDRV